MKILIKIICVSIIFSLIGCASVQQPVMLNQEVIAASSSKMGVVMTTTPKAETYFPGAGCLLCIAVAEAAHSSLTTYTHTLPVDEVSAIKTEVINTLKNSGVDVVVIPDSINIETLPNYGKSGPTVAKKDFTALKTKYNIDRLLVINISTVGFERKYSSYFPTSDPTGIISGDVSIVNLSDNAYDWYLPLNIVKGTDGNWDEPDKYPGLTNAYFQVIELAKDSLTRPLANASQVNKVNTPAKI